MCLYGFGKSLAVEGMKKNVFCNMIAPVAGTRITETVLPKEVLEKIKPEYIGPFVATLCHESCSINGRTFEVGGGYFSCVKPQIAEGNFVDSPFDIEKYLSELEMSKNNRLATQKPYSVEANKNNRLKDKVIVITRAGKGFGEKCSIDLSRLGASVILVDPSKNTNGDFLVDILSRNINKSGGKSFPVPLGLSDSEKILEKIGTNYKTIDLLINCEGPKSNEPFDRMKDDEWESVFNANLNETFLMIKSISSFFVTQKFGKIINLLSLVSLTGNFGQTNYSASTAGIWGLSKTLFLEFKKKNIDIGILAPFEYNGKDKGISNKFDVGVKQNLSDFIISVCGDKVKLEGESYAVGSDSVSIIKMARSELFNFQGCDSKGIIQRIIASLKMEKSSHPKDAQTSFLSFIQAVNDHDQKSVLETSSSKKVSVDDIIKYHISIGFTHKDLDYVYENSGNFKILLTFSTIFVYDFLPNFNFGKILNSFEWVNLLHLGQNCHWIRKIDPDSVINSKALISACKKASNGSLVSLQINSSNDKGELVYTNDILLYIKNSTPKKEFGEISRPTIHFKSTEESCDINIPENSAVLFRLSGDKNPLHM